MNFILSSLLALVACVLCAQSVIATPCTKSLGHNYSAYTNVTMAYLLTQYQLPDALVVDVREPSEHKPSHIPNSVNLPLSVLESHLKDIPTNVRLFVHCVSGVRSTKASTIMSAFGLTKVFNVHDGIKAWTGPVVPTPTPAYVSSSAQELLKVYNSPPVVGYLIIDTRNPDAFKASHIPGSMNIPMFVPLGDRVPWVKQVYVISNNPSESLNFSKMLDEDGYSSIYNVVDGIQAWKGPLTQGNGDVVFQHIQGARLFPRSGPRGIVDLL